MTAAAAELEHGAALSALARILSLGFTYPDGDALEEIGALVRGLLARTGLAEGLAEPLAELLAALDGGGLQEEFGALFEGATRCPPYGGSYAADPFRHVRQMADVAGFYRAFGAEVSGERPDHAGAELEFLAFLVAKRIAALAAGAEEEAEVCRGAEDKFLLDHLGRWVPALCRGVAAETSSPYYAALARLGRRVVGAELAQRGLRPEPLRKRVKWAVEGDEVECGGDPIAASLGDMSEGQTPGHVHAPKALPGA